MPCTHPNHNSLVSHTSIAITLAPSHYQYTHIQQKQQNTHQSPHPHVVPRQPHRQAKDDYMTTHTTQAHRPSSKSERNLIILPVDINGIKNKLVGTKLLILNTHVDIIIIQERNSQGT